MKLNGLNIFGIKHIVITGKSPAKWTRIPVFTGNIKKEHIWVKNYSTSEFESSEPAMVKPDPKMIDFVKFAIANPDNYKIWIHTDTINIRPINME